MTDDVTIDELDIGDAAREIADDPPTVEPAAADLPDDVYDGDAGAE